MRHRLDRERRASLHPERGGVYNGGPALWDEYAPGRTFYYGYSNGTTGGNRVYDKDVTPGAPANQRTYTYDSQGRLRTVSLYRPRGATTTQDSHTIAILYDHVSRPIYVTVRNNALAVETRHQYFYDLQNRLTGRIETNTSAPTYSETGTYVYIEPLLVGEIHRSTTTSTVEYYRYSVLSPEGVPQAGWGFARFSPYLTVESWRAQYTPFGRRLSLTVATSNPPPPPMRFVGQIELPSSDASWWNGSTTFISRDPLVLNSWRVYDSRVGEYLQPEPLAIAGAEVAPTYTYAAAAPADFIDPDGLELDSVSATCARNPALCREIRPPASAGRSGRWICQYLPFLCFAPEARDPQRRPEPDEPCDQPQTPPQPPPVREPESDRRMCQRHYEQCLFSPLADNRGRCTLCWDFCIGNGYWDFFGHSGFECDYLQRSPATPRPPRRRR